MQASDQQPRILIVEANADLALIWLRHLERQGLYVECCDTADSALEHVVSTSFSVILINLVLPGGGAFGIADYARIKSPGSNIVFVTNDSFFRDGSLFGLVPNLRMTINAGTPPEDVATIVSHYAAAS